MIFLVVVLHAGLVYESSGIGASFWIVDDPATNDLSGLLNLIIDLCAMPTIFFISGFLVPLSLSRQGARDLSVLSPSASGALDDLFSLD